MFIKKGVFINWGNIPELEFDFGPINLFSGGNGSGKTTAADGIQALMTAAHDNLFTFNPGQDETTQRGRGGKQVRTLASYVLGCDDGSYSRPWDTDGYIAVTFHPTSGESGEKFTAVMAMRAHIDKAGITAQARLDKLIFLVIPGEALTLDHFIKEYPDGRHVVPITDLADLLKKEFGSKQVEVYEKKRTYLKRLYGALRGKRDAVPDREAMHAARTFSSFMAYKPVKSINEFVAREVLEKKDLGEAIRSVSDLMKTIHGMEAEARNIADALGILQKAALLSQNYQTQWIALSLLCYQESKRLFDHSHRTYLRNKKEQKQLQDNIREDEQKIVICDERRKQAHREMVQLEAQRQGISALQDKDELEERIRKSNSQLVALAQPLLEQDHQLVANGERAQQLSQVIKAHSIAVDIPALEDKNTKQLIRKVADLKENGRIDLQRLMGKDWVDIAPLEEHLDEVLVSEKLHNQLAYQLHDAQASDNNISVRDQMSRLLSSNENQMQQYDRQMTAKQQEINSLEAKQVTYPPHVQQAIHAIEEQCPSADPRVLCDYIEVTDSKWQMAIEGYIGGGRFSIIVEPEYEAQAARILRNLPGKRNRAKIIQGEKAQRDADRFSQSANSIFQVMEFSHKTAEFYIKASYGNVERVDDAETLKGTARGITAEGLACGSYSMWRCDVHDAELVFGQGARARALSAKIREHQQLVDQANHANDRYVQLSRAFKLVDGIQPVRYSAVIEEMLTIHRSLKQAESTLSSLDLSDHKILEDQLTALRDQFDDLELQGKNLMDQLGGCREKLKQNKRQIEKMADERDELEADLEMKEVAVKNIAKLKPLFDVSASIAEADTLAAAAGSDFNFELEVEQKKRALEKTSTDLLASVLEHNRQCMTHDAIAYEPDYNEAHTVEFFKRITGLQLELDTLHNRFKNNVLVEKLDNLRILKESFNTAFVTNLCHSIYQAINDGKRILDDLNKELEHHRFGADQERFYFDCQWVPEFKEYWSFFKEVIGIANLGDGTTLFNADLKSKSVAIRDKLMAMLLDDDEQKAMRELERISDYRNYRNYEIYKEPKGKAPIALSKYGTGSGGQLETPAYIIRSAAITSAFRFNEGNAHLRMVLVDEAFSKMDEYRSREVINYLTKTLGLQLIFIMPTSKSGPFMDLISNQFIFSKCPTQQPNGELNTRVLVDRKACNEENIKALWSNHRRTVRHQGALDFMEEFVEV